MFEAEPVDVVFRKGDDILTDRIYGPDGVRERGEAVGLAYGFLRQMDGVQLVVVAVIGELLFIGHPGQHDALGKGQREVDSAGLRFKQVIVDVEGHGHKGRESVLVCLKVRDAREGDRLGAFRGVLPL